MGRCDLLIRWFFGQNASSQHAPTEPVQDYGRGIAADQAPHLLERFYQVARPDRPWQGGMGLGLFICQEVVSAHGGRIAVASTEGEGTTFTGWLPLTETAVGERGTPDA